MADGGLLRRDYYNREIWKPALGTARLPADVTFYGLRLTFAHWCVTTEPHIGCSLTHPPDGDLMIDDTSLIWYALRARRSTLVDRSKLGESASRRQTFAAAMGQFEEQLTAAKIVTAATRPLNLYYGLAQAGMAIAAAHGPDQWSFSRHGLKVVDTHADFADIEIRTDGDGGFQRAASTTGSANVTAPVSVGALWASLPDLAGSPLPSSDRPTPVLLSPEHSVAGAPRVVLFLDEDMLSGEPAELPAKVYELTAHYPGAQDGKVPMERGAIQAPPRRGGRWAVRLEWPPRPPWEMSDQEFSEFYDRIAREYRYRDERYLRPSVEGNGVLPPSPLMTWWLLLYCFSILARYQPQRWAALLDLDKSRCAAHIQFALETALSVVPHLVLEAFDREPILLAKPFGM